MRRYRLAVAVLMTLTAPIAAKAETLRVYAAGSLRAALVDLTRTLETRHPGLAVELELAASGLLRERIEKGEQPHLFASADVGHPTRLANAGFARTPVAIFARNQLCALAREGLAVTTSSLLDTLLDRSVRVGTSTPKADPSGDYAFALFAKAEAARPGARVLLEGKALQLTGGPESRKAPEGKNVYAWVMADGQADIFLTYCTNAVLAKEELPGLQVVQIAPDLNVAADCGMIVLKDAPVLADRLAGFILGDEGQAVLTKYGFGRGGSPRR